MSVLSYEIIRSTWVTACLQTGHDEFSVFTRVAHSMQKKLWPQGTNAATTSALQQITHSFFFAGTLLFSMWLLLVVSTLVGEREPITPPLVRTSALLTVVVVAVSTPHVPSGAVVEVGKSGKGARAEVVGREGRRGSLARRRTVACGVVGRPLPREPMLLRPLFTLVV